MEQQVTPLPKLQLFVTALIVFTEPIMIVFLFPFVYFMVEGFGVAESEDQIGFYVGILSAAFPASQFLTAFVWGYCSDKVGRKPILVVSAFVAGISLICFGLSTSYTMAIIFRIVGGLMSGSLGVAKTVIGEITDSTNRAKGFSIMGFVTGTGFILAPLLGGFLSDPARNYPSLFGEMTFFVKFPYFLPCLAVGVIGIFDSVCGFIFLKESRKKQSEEDKLMSPPSASTASVILKPFVIACISLYGLVSFSSIIFDESFAIFAVEEVVNAGLELTSERMGIALTFGGFCLLFTQLFIFPSLIKRITPLHGYMGGSILMIPVYLIFPLLHLVARKQHEAELNDEDHMSTTVMFWAFLLSLISFRTIFAVISFTCSMIIISNCVVPEYLGAANGLGQMLTSGLRAAGPFLAGSLWSWTRANDYPFPFNHFFVFILAATVCCFGFVVAFFIPKRANKPATLYGDDMLVETSMTNYGALGGH